MLFRKDAYRHAWDVAFVISLGTAVVAGLAVALTGSTIATVVLTVAVILSAATVVD